VSDEVRRARDVSYNPDDPADLWENITPVSPAEFAKGSGDVTCTCGGHLTAAPDSQYGTLWTCDRCGLTYADDEDETR
jgi:hypothetical protein